MNVSEFCKPENFYLFKLAGILLLTLLLSLAENALFHRLYTRVQASSRMVNEAGIYAIHLPLRAYILFSGLVFSTAIFFPGLWVQTLHQVGAFFLFIWALLRFIKKLEAIQNTKYDLTTTQGVSHLLKIFVVIFAALGAMQFLGIPLSGLLAFGGLGGIAVGFAAKDLLANFFGGLMIFLDRPFRIGDWIRSPDQKIEGIVEHIGWRLTRIQTFEKRPLFVPNSVFSTITLENPGRMSHRKISVTLRIVYEDAEKVPALLSQIEKLLKTHPDLDPTTPFFANLVDFGPYGLEVLIVAFTKITDGLKFQIIQQDVLLKILEKTQNQQAKVATPPHLS